MDSHDPTLSPLEWVCESCGATSEVSPDAATFECAYCGRSVENERPEPLPATIPDHDYLERFDRPRLSSVPKTTEPSPSPDPSSGEDPSALSRLSCRSCGATFECPADQSKVTCPYCGTESERNLPLAPPEGLAIDAFLAPKLSEKQARANIQSWLRGQPWIKIGEKKRILHRPLRACFLTYWTFEAVAQTEYRGAVGTVKQTTEERGTRVITRQEIHWNTVEEKFRTDYQGLPVCANFEWPGEILDNLGPLDLSSWQVYREKEITPFLSPPPGFSILPYDLDVDEAFEPLSQQREHELRRKAESELKGERTRMDGITTQWENVRYRRVLVPMFSLAPLPTEERLHYSILVHGCTGAVSGDLPLSPLKIASVMILALLTLSWLLNILI